MADKEERDKKDSLSEKLKNPQWKAAIAAFLIFLILFTWTQYFIPGGPVRYDINYSKFLEQLDAGNIKSVSMKKLEVSGEFIKDIDILPPGQKKAIPAKEFRTFLPSFQGEGLLSKLEEKHVVINVEAPEEKSLFWQFIIGFLPWILIIGVWFFIMRRAQQQVQGGAGGLFTFGSSKAKLYEFKKTSITFKDVAGMENVKQELRETIEFLKDPSKYLKIGAKVPKGVLLIGPPGTGKTLLARATAGEAGVPFYSISAS